MPHDINSQEVQETASECSKEGSWEEASESTKIPQQGLAEALEATWLGTHSEISLDILRHYTDGIAAERESEVLFEKLKEQEENGIVR